jgi:hypothetical protein
VVPGRRVLTVVHIRDPDVEARRQTQADLRYPGTGAAQLTPDSHDGHTLCGLPMLAGDLWRAWDPDVKADRICTECETGQGGYTQEAML